MKPRLWQGILLTFSLLMPGSFAASAAPSSAAVKPALPPGVELPQTVSMITGVAISPLLGVSALGAWKYYNTPPARRAQLHWFAQPCFWLPAKVEKGKRKALDIVGRTGGYGVKEKMPAQEWSTLRVNFAGPRFVVLLNGKELFAVEDTTFLEAGQVGLWTKADSVTLFDDFRYGTESK